MTKTCSELFQGMDCTIIGNGNEEVAGLAFRSDEVRPNDMFFCIVGTVVDGHSFAQDAIDRGATSLVAERKVYLADATDVTEVVVSDSRKAMAYASANYYDNPSRAFSLVGITGTNGKTTTTYLVEHIASVAGNRCGVIGTVGNKIAGAMEHAERTTPDALDLRRTWDTDFAVTAFTNLTQDHLDYHHTFDDYFEAKALLFSKDYPARRVISIDGSWGRELLRRCTAAGDEVITTGFDVSAQIHPVEVTYEAARTKAVLEVRGTRIAVEYPLVGRFNVENVMTAFGCALALGIPAQIIAEALATMPAVPGRLERVRPAVDAPVSVYVDYAHTPDALENVLTSAKGFAKGRVVALFGCGGDRDRTKRPKMGSIAAELADLVIVTSDNPRTEDPEAIIEDILTGMTDTRTPYAVVPNRIEAIHYAMDHARSGDVIILAGKGHETYQIIGHEKHHLDEREVVADYIRELQQKERA